MMLRFHIQWRGKIIYVGHDGMERQEEKWFSMDVAAESIEDATIVWRLHRKEGREARNPISIECCGEIVVDPMPGGTAAERDA